MAGILGALTGLFGGSNKIRIVPLYTMRNNLISWRESGHYPGYYDLPPGISFDVNFWERVKEIYRHTTSDKHERAVSVWWVDGEFILTEQVRGTDSRVNIPAQRVSVAYRQIKGTNTGERVVMIDGKVERKKTVDIETLRRMGGKKIEVSHLFHMHTHPPREGVEVGSAPDYSFFSHTDIKGFVSSKAAFSGLVTDKLWLIAKTSETPGVYTGDSTVRLTPQILTNTYRIKVYLAEFGRSAIVVRPDVEPGDAAGSPA